MNERVASVYCALQVSNSEASTQKQAEQALSVQGSTMQHRAPFVIGRKQQTPFADNILPSSALPGLAYC